MTLTLKQEAFCQAYVENGGNASDAYRTAYGAEKYRPESLWSKASSMLATDKVRKRVDELKAAHRERHMITVDSLVAELEEARLIALNAATPQTAAAVSATLGKAKLAGLDKQIVEMTSKHIFDESQAKRMMEQFLNK